MEGYSCMKECHNAVSGINEALKHWSEVKTEDEEKVVLELLSKAVVEFERGTQVEIDVTARDGEIAKMAEELRIKMLENLERFKKLQKILDPSMVSSKEPVEPQVSSTDPKKLPKKSPFKCSKDDQNLVNAIERSMLEPDNIEESMDDIVGLVDVKEILKRNVMLPIKNPESYTGNRKPHKGLILFGPPGNGKTMLAKVMARECGYRFFNVTSADLISKNLGDTEKCAKILFAVVKYYQPSIIFIDEIDGLFSSNEQHDAITRFRLQFQQEFEGVCTTEKDQIFVFGATNKPQVLDGAILSRLPIRVYVPLPSFKARRTALQKLLTKDKHCLSGIEISKIACCTFGYSFRDIAGLAKEAALIGITEDSSGRVKCREISYDDYKSALSKIKPNVAIEILRELEDWNDKNGTK